MRMLARMSHLVEKSSDYPKKPHHTVHHSQQRCALNRYVTDRVHARVSTVAAALELRVGEKNI